MSMYLTYLTCCVSCDNTQRPAHRPAHCTAHAHASPCVMPCAPLDDDHASTIMTSYSEFLKLLHEIPKDPSSQPPSLTPKQTYEQLCYDFPQLAVDELASFKGDFLKQVEGEKYSTYPITNKFIHGITYGASKYGSNLNNTNTSSSNNISNIENNTNTSPFYEQYSAINAISLVKFVRDALRYALPPSLISYVFLLSLPLPFPFPFLLFFPYSLFLSLTLVLG